MGDRIGSQLANLSFAWNETSTTAGDPEAWSDSDAFSDVHTPSPPDPTVGPTKDPFGLGDVAPLVLPEAAIFAESMSAVDAHGSDGDHRLLKASDLREYDAPSPR